MPRWWTLVLMCCVFCCVPAWAAEVAPEALASWQRLNRVRMAPPLEPHRFRAALPVGLGGLATPLSWEVVDAEFAELAAQAPLALDPALCASARQHASWMARHKQSHYQTEGSAGFLAVQPAQRMLLSGFKGQPVSENAVRDSFDPQQAHLSLVIDWGPGPENMQPGRGHRVAMMHPRMNCVGIGVRGHGDRLALVQNFGLHRAYLPTTVCGLVYEDRNGNGLYDAGEGDDAATVAWGDGAAAPVQPGGWFVLTQGDTASVRIVDGAGRSYDWQPPRAQGVMWCEWGGDAGGVPASWAADASVAERRATWVQWRDRCLDPGDRKRLRQHCGEAVEASDEDRHEALEDLAAGRRVDAPREITGAEAMWFDDARSVRDCYSQLHEVGSRSRAGRALQARSLRAGLRDLRRFRPDSAYWRQWKEDVQAFFSGMRLRR